MKRGSEQPFPTAEELEREWRIAQLGDLDKHQGPVAPYMVLWQMRGEPGFERYYPKIDARAVAPKEGEGGQLEFEF